MKLQNGDNCADTYLQTKDLLVLVRYFFSTISTAMRQGMAILLPFLGLSGHPVSHCISPIKTE